MLSGKHVYNPKAVVSVMMRGSFQSYWSQTGTYESLIPLIDMDFDGLRAAIISMISGNEIKVRTTTFQNDMVSFKNKDDVLTLLIHLGYLAFNQKIRWHIFRMKSFAMSLWMRLRKTNGMKSCSLRDSQ